MLKRLALDARLLNGKSLEYHRFLGNDYIADFDGLRAGWIVEGLPSKAGEIWLWTMTGPSCGPARVTTFGSCGTLEEAKTEMSRAFDQWKNWAARETGPVAWFG